ncbi:MAG: polymer-forming cytoskeletal protein [Oscillospiraceae bacterium]|nr:polymer-forming cytoskeletal protein [Oscillospiraceae bacterium]
MKKTVDKKQIMFDMFGVGEVQENIDVEMDEQKDTPAAAPVAAPTPAVPAAPEKFSGPNMSYLSHDAVLEGNLRTDSDVEISGRFKGNIDSKGSVTLRSNVQGNISAKGLHLSGCTLIGDVTALGMVIINHDSTICGNVTAKDISCAGKITGDLIVSGNTSLEETAWIEGVVTTSTMTVSKGAVIQGGIQIGASKK